MKPARWISFAVLMLISLWFALPARAYILDFSGNTTDEAWKGFEAGDYVIRAGTANFRSDAIIEIEGNTITLVPGRARVPLLILDRPYLGGFYINSFDVALDWIGDPLLEPDYIGDLSMLFHEFDSTGAESFHVNGWDTYTHVNPDVANELYLLGFSNEWNSNVKIRLANIDLNDGRLPGPIPPVTSPIPEPSNYLMMLLGLGLFGYVGLKKKIAWAKKPALSATRGRTHYAS